jgi:hypothetical protein
VIGLIRHGRFGLADVLAMKPEEATWWVRNLQAVIDREQAP